VVQRRAATSSTLRYRRSASPRPSYPLTTKFFRCSWCPGVEIEPRREQPHAAIPPQRVATRLETRLRRVAGARSGDRTHIPFQVRDFKSLASTSFAIRAQAHGAACASQTEIPAGAGIRLRVRSGCGKDWRPRSELNRRTRICSPLHNHSATRPVTLDAFTSRAHGANRSPKTMSGKTDPGNCKAPRAGPWLNLERETRLELATPTLARSCSTN
jgi:hypothetical protein